VFKRCQEPGIQIPGYPEGGASDMTSLKLPVITDGPVRVKATVRIGPPPIPIPFLFRTLPGVKNQCRAMPVHTSY